MVHKRRVYRLAQCTPQARHGQAESHSQPSADAELYAMVHGGSEGLGARAMGLEFGLSLVPHLHVYASAAIGIAQGHGLGNVRHIDVGFSVDTTDEGPEITTIQQDQGLRRRVGWPRRARRDQARRRGGFGIPH